MRMMLKVSIPVEPGDAGIQTGQLQQITAEALDTLKPEAAYFFAEGGVRTALMVFDLADPSDIPSVLEPFLGGLNAGVSLTPVMNADDLRRAFGKLPS
jgi:hypothetical protein